jgi:uncharacterized protein involved in type VI secretion and phage assembly
VGALGELWNTIATRGLEALGRFYSVYRAKVVDNKDPDFLGRIKVSCPYMNRGADLPQWVVPMPSFAGADHGIIFVPEIGEGVWIKFERGDKDYPMYTAQWWGTGEMPADFKKNPPTARGIRTKAKHQLLFDDDPAKLKVELRTSKGHIIQVDEIAETLLIKTVKGMKMLFEDKTKKITVTDAGGDTLTMSNGATKIVCKTAQVEASAKAYINSPNVILGGTSGGPTERILRYKDMDKFKCPITKQGHNKAPIQIPPIPVGSGPAKAVD